MKVLVTGAAGFLGRYVVRQLVQRGDSVRVLCRRSDEEFNSLGVEVLQADIRDREQVIAACAGIDGVIHIAGVMHMWGRWKEFYSVNLTGSENILAGCQQHGVTRLVYTSSPSVTFSGVGQENVDEALPYPNRWLAYYPQTKALAEKLILSTNGTKGLLTCALRPHLIWGPGDRQLLPRLLERARQGKIIRVGDGQNLVDTVYVENAAEAHLQALDRLTPGSPVAGKAYFISQGEPIRLWDWIDQLLALDRLPPVSRWVSLKMAYVSGWVLENVYRMLWRKSEPDLTRFVALQLGLPHYFDISAARRDLGYVPSISTAEGLKRLAADPIFQAATAN